MGSVRVLHGVQHYYSAGIYLVILKKKKINSSDLRAGEVLHQDT